MKSVQHYITQHLAVLSACEWITRVEDLFPPIFAILNDVQINTNEERELLIDKDEYIEIIKEVLKIE